MLVAASAAVTLFSVLSAASPVAATAAVGAAHSKRVGAAKPSGYIACDAHVVTDANLQPRATTSYQSGYAPAQLRTAYGLTTDAMTVAIIDAYANPNAAADLASYRSQFGLGGTTLTQLNQTGGPISTVSGNTGWGQEEMRPGDGLGDLQVLAHPLRRSQLRLVHRPCRRCRHGRGQWRNGHLQLLRRQRVLHRSQHRDTTSGPG